MSIVVFSPEKYDPPTTKGIVFNDVLLEVGANTLSEEDTNRVIGHPLFSMFEEWGAICLGKAADKALEIEQSSLPESTPTPEPLAPILPNLDIMNGSEAIALIHTIHDADQLAALLEQEIAHDNRKTVIAAIHRQQGE